MSTLSSFADTKKIVKPNNLTGNKETTGGDADKVLFNLSKNTFGPKKTSPADSGFQNNDFRWGEKDLLSYYDLDKNGVVHETNINKGLTKSKDLNDDNVLDLKDFVKAFTAAIEDKKSDEHKQHFQVTQNAFKSKDSNHDSPFTNADTKIHEQMVSGEKTKQA